MSRLPSLLILCTLVAGCAAPQPVVKEEVKSFDGKMPADFSGYWQRDYTRDEDINGALQDAYYRMARAYPDPRLSRSPVPVGPSASDVNEMVALARLADLITRPDTLTIVQNENEIRVDRKDDYSMLCSFYDGVAKGIDSPYGRETCGWDGNVLISHLVLPNGLQINHRFTMSPRRTQLRITTTLKAAWAKEPFVIRRYYTRFERRPPDYNCVETLSMKRVCSTGDLGL